MPPPYILSIDQGTTSSRALVVDRDGMVVSSGQVSFEQLYPRPGWVEHDPEEIWRSVQEAIRLALAEAGTEPRELAAIGITNQRETVVAWERATGAPVYKAIVWQDRRTAAFCDELRAAGHEADIEQATGLTLDPYFSGTKLRWLLDEVPGLRQRAEAGEIAAGTIDSWLVWKLAAGMRHITDYTNASRTLLFNIRRGRWDEGMLELFGVPRAMLPVAAPSRAPFATTSGSVMGAEVPILAVAGDQQAALYGQGCVAPGQAKNTYGTGCFLLANAGRNAIRSQNRLLTSIGAGAGREGPEYVLEGSVFVAGALVQWLRDGLGIISTAEEVEALAASVPDAGGVVVVPAHTGLGAPYWDARARGAIVGITRGTTSAHIARAALEAIALASTDLALAMAKDLGAPLGELRVDGGACKDDLLMQLQADYLGAPVVRPRNVESTAMGAAFLAGREAGTWSSDEEVASLARVERVFEPRIGADEREAKLQEWHRAVERSLDWAQE